MPMSVARQYWSLTKPRVVALIVFTAAIGMFLAVPGLPPLRESVLGFLGIWLAASSAAAINQLLDSRIDAKMARTSWRPIVVGQITHARALAFALVLATLSMLLLVVFVNTITAVLTFASLIGYAVIYTVYLKRATSQNIVIGGLAGATPPMLGWAAVTGLPTSADWVNASLLVLIIFIWTPPHFWALSLWRSGDYARAGVPMLPVVKGKPHTRLQILLYTLVLVPLGLTPSLIGLGGPLYLAAAAGLGLWFLWEAIATFRERDMVKEAAAHRLFGVSLLYLAALFAALIVERLAGIAPLALWP